MKFLACLVALSLILVSSCIGHIDRKAVHEQREVAVALEKQARSTAYGHPYTIDAADIRVILANLKFKGGEGVWGAKKEIRLFQEKELDRISGPLAEALSTASGSQHVRFVSLNRSKSLMLFTIYQVTEGIVFVDNKKQLNLAFCRINKKVDTQEGEADVTNLKAEFSGKNPLEILKSEKTIVSLPPEFRRHQSNNGRAYPMWVAFSLDKAPALSVKPEELTPVSKPAPPKKMGLKEKVRDELRYLKGLLDEGLISEADYDIRKQRLLEQLSQ